MPLLIAVLTALGGAMFWIWRMRMAAQATHELAGLAGEALAAARRLGFRRRHNAHPVESIEDPDLAIAATGLAFLELAALPTAEQHTRLQAAIARHCDRPAAEALEMMTVGRWLITESQGPQHAIPRLTKRLHKLDPAAGQTLLAVLGAVSDNLSQRQREALEEIGHALRLAG